MPKMVKIVVGNKNDLGKEKRKVKLTEGKAFAEQKNLEFFETSALGNDGSLNDIFATLANKIRESFSVQELS